MHAPLFQPSVLEGLFIMTPPVTSTSSATSTFTPAQGHVIWNGSRITDRIDSRIEFPSLVRFGDHWYCAFREAPIHNNHPLGRARIIRSADGQKWDTAIVLDWDCADVREVKLAITSEGCLMANTSVYFTSRQPRKPGESSRPDAKTYTPPEGRKATDHADRYYRLDWTGTPLNLADHDNEPDVSQQTVTWLSRDGQNWSSAYACETGINSWRWDVTWHEGMGYSTAQWGRDTPGTIYRTRDGKSWRAFKHNLFPKDHGGEMAMAFTDTHMIGLLRGNHHAMLQLGSAAGPYYQDWQWRIPMIDMEGNGQTQPASEVLKVSLGGPTMLKLSDGRIIAAGRTLAADHPDGRATLYWLDHENSTLTRFAVCDGTSYPGLWEYQGKIWVSYIGSACSHNQWEVRLASFDLDDLPTRNQSS